MPSGTPSLDPILAGIASHEPLVRATSVALLVEHYPAEYEARRRALLHDEDGGVVEATLEAVARHLPGEISDEAKEAFLDEREGPKGAGARGIARWGDEASLATLLDALQGGQLPQPWVPGAFVALAAARESDVLDRARRHKGEMFGIELARRLAVAAPEGEGEDEAEKRRARCQAVIEESLGDDDDEVRAAALDGLADAGWRFWEDQARRRLDDDAWEIREVAVKLMGRSEADDALDLILGKFEDEDEDVRRTALTAAAERAPARRAELALRLLGDWDDDVCQKAVELLAEATIDADVIEAAIGKLAEAQGTSGRRILDLVREHAPERLEEARDVALHSTGEQTRTAAATMLIEEAQRLHAAAAEDGASPETTEAAEAMLGRVRLLLGDTGQAVRVGAISALYDLEPPETGRMLAVQAIHDASWQIRVGALERLREDPDPLLVDELLPLARDQDATVRRTAIGVLAKFDDRRVVSEIVSSLDDVDQAVQTEAKAVLEGERGAVPSLQRVLADDASLIEPDEPDTVLGDAVIPGAERKPWDVMRARIDAIHRWAVKVGQELLGKSVTVVQYRQGLGCTREVPRSKTAELEISDTPITSGHPHGEEIMRGLALHEIGHHLCDIGVRGHRTMRGIARSEGLSEIYDILRDERLERVLRSRRPQWGKLFDRLASYAFAQESWSVPLERYAELLERPVDEVAEALEARELPGKLITESLRGPKVSLRERDMLAIPGMVPPLPAWLACLRCGFDPREHPNPVVKAAIDVVPPNLKDLTHAEVVAVARKVADLIGRSDDHQRGMQRMRRTMRRFGDVTRGMRKWLDRIRRRGQLPAALRPEDGPPPDPHASPVRRQPQQQRPPPVPSFGPPSGRRELNLGPEKDFKSLEKEETIPFDPAAYAALVATIRKHVRRLRAYLERLGKRRVEEFASRRGRRLDLAQAKRTAFSRSPNLLVFETEELAADAYIGILIDRSGSMGRERMERAKSFGALVAESARGIRGLEGHVTSFDGYVFYHLGDLQRNAVASLYAHNGNNDAGGLEKAAQLALASRKKNKLILMISDGAPTECTFESLKNLVERLGRDHGIACAQVAVAPIDQIAFPHYVDLTAFTLDEAIARFGSTLMRLTASWR